MNKLTLTFIAITIADLKDYLLSLPGVTDVTITPSEKDGTVIEITYKDDVLKPNLILDEIELYSKVYHRPIMIGFDKHVSGAKEIRYKKPNICCEFCFLNMIYDFFYSDKVYSFKHETDDINNIYDNFGELVITSSLDKDAIDEIFKIYAEEKNE